MNARFRTVLNDLADKHGNVSARKVASLTLDQKQIINSYLDNEKFLNLPITQQLYWIKNSLIDFPKCNKCGKSIKNFRSFKDGYPGTTCSRSCQRLLTADIKGRKEKPTKKSKEELKESYVQAIKTREQTCIKKYGIKSPFHSGQFVERRIANKNLEFVKSRIEKFSNKFKACFDISEYVGSKTKYDWLCLTCNTNFKDNIANGSDPVCPVCYTPNASKAQHEISDFIKSLNFNVRMNDRSLLKNRELDLVVESKNFAIEFNGNYWHSEKANIFSKNHLYEKLKRTNEIGFSLINIFEDEWAFKTDIVKSIISNKLNSNIIKIAARKCEIVTLSKNECDTFLEQNHIQGHDNASIRYGLIFNNELISVMTFCKPRFDKNAEWELSRFCSKLNSTVIGGASKLFAHFVKTNKPKNVISYADLRYGTGNVYSFLNFKLIKENTGINYSYLKNNSLNRISRYKCQKSKLKDFLTVFDESKTETENMQINGYFKIWDCGNSKWEWKP